MNKIAQSQPQRPTKHTTKLVTSFIVLVMLKERLFISHKRTSKKMPKRPTKHATKLVVSSTDRDSLKKRLFISRKRTCKKIPDAPKKSKFDFDMSFCRIEPRNLFGVIV
jgi:hypothetical protein